MEVRSPSPDLDKEDLAPARERRWAAFSIFNIWTSGVHSLRDHYLAASLFLLRGSFLNFSVAIGAVAYQPLSMLIRRPVAAATA
jgi:NCS1 family nucleobase:cation symporter-1